MTDRWPHRTPGLLGCVALGLGFYALIYMAIQVVFG